MTKPPLGFSGGGRKCLVQKDFGLGSQEQKRSQFDKARVNRADPNAALVLTKF